MTEIEFPDAYPWYAFKTILRLGLYHAGLALRFCWMGELPNSAKP